MSLGASRAPTGMPSAVPPALAGGIPLPTRTENEMPHHPLRTLVDWTPETGDVDEWLAQWEVAGWVPEHPWGGVDCDVRGVTVVRWAMIQREPADPA